jgi:protoheme IX farnesyltransferase
VIGGAAGAFPPMIGWAAVTGTITIDSCILFLIIFLWTPPHFWALALYKQSDYAAAGIPMLPNVAGEAVTKQQILIYAVVYVAATLLPSALGSAGWLYTMIAAITGASFVLLAWRLFRTKTDSDMRRSGRTLFLYSLSHLAIIFLALLTDHAGRFFGAL